MNYKFTKPALPYRGPTDLNDMTVLFNSIIHSIIKLNKVLDGDTGYGIMIQNNHQALWEGNVSTIYSNIPANVIICKNGERTTVSLTGLSPLSDSGIMNKIDKLISDTKDMFNYEYRN